MTSNARTSSRCHVFPFEKLRLLFRFALCTTTFPNLVTIISYVIHHRYELTSKHKVPSLLPSLTFILVYFQIWNQSLIRSSRFIHPRKQGLDYMMFRIIHSRRALMGCHRTEIGGEVVINRWGMVILLKPEWWRGDQYTPRDAYFVILLMHLYMDSSKIDMY